VTHPTQIRGELAALQGRADCKRRRVGALLIHRETGEIVGRGWNALAPTDGSCTAGSCPRGLLSYAEQPAFTGYEASGCESVHAEIRAVHEASEHGRLYSGELVCFVTATPCEDCTATLYLVGAEVVVVQMPGAVLAPDQLP
jgi:deoxycytidylate deaminase